MIDLHRIILDSLKVTVGYVCAGARGKEETNGRRADVEWRGGRNERSRQCGGEGASSWFSCCGTFPEWATRESKKSNATHRLPINGHWGAQSVAPLSISFRVICWRLKRVGKNRRKKNRRTTSGVEQPVARAGTILQIENVIVASSVSTALLYVCYYAPENWVKAKGGRTKFREFDAMRLLEHRNLSDDGGRPLIFTNLTIHRRSWNRRKENHRREKYKCWRLLSKKCRLDDFVENLIQFVWVIILLHLFVIGWCGWAKFLRFQ